MAMNDATDLIDINVHEPPADEETVLASLNIDARDGWSIRVLVENTPEYTGDGVEGLEPECWVYFTHPEELRDLARYFEEKAEKMEEVFGDYGHDVPARDTGGGPA